MPHVDSIDTYRLSFTFGGLLIPETREVARQYRALGDWDAARRRITEENLLQKTRASSVYRYVREIRARLKVAYAWEIDVVAGSGNEAHGSVNGNVGFVPDRDVPVVLYAVFTRYYRLVGDFVTQVVRRRLLEGLPTVDNAMVRSFMADQAPAHPEITRLSESTANKLAAVTIRVLAEAGIVHGRRGTLPITPPPLTSSLRRYYCETGSAEDLTHLLLRDKEIARCLT